MMVLSVAPTVCHGLNIKSIQGKSMKQNLLRFVAASAVVLMGPVAAGVAHATNVSTAKVTLSKFSYKVTDMDTRDGVAASLTFQPGIADGTQLSIYDVPFNGLVSQTNQANDFVPGGVFDAGKGTATLGSMPLAKASKVGTTLTAQSGFTNVEARTILNGPYETQVFQGGAYIGLQRAADVESSSFSAFGPPGLAFELAPHTSVTFSGKFDLATGVDMRALFNSDALVKARAHDASLEVTSVASVYLSIQDDTYFNQAEPLAADGPQYVYAGATRTGTIDQLGHLSLSGDAPTAQGVLKLTFTNASDHAVGKVLNYGLKADSYLSVVSVPEPGTWALMVLGLAGVAVASRQRRTA